MAKLPEFWASHVAKVIVGEQPCLLSVWARPHLGFEKPMETPERQAGLTLWKQTHTEMLDQTAGLIEELGWKVRKEVFFRIAGSTASVAGKVDLTAQKDKERPLIIDTKGGEPRESDVAQVLTYMCLLPLAWNAPTMLFNGRVVYRNHPAVDLTPKHAADFKPGLMKLLKRLGSTEQPQAYPSRDSCRWCEVPELICPDRYVEVPDAVTEEF